MRVHQKEVSVVCKTKRDGKQLAAQKLLQQLHPQIESWGALLRLYGSRAMLEAKSKREKEAEVTKLQSRTRTRPFPSLAILDKLQSEMRILNDIRKAAVPLGKFVESTIPGSACTKCGESFPVPTDQSTSFQRAHL